MIFCARDALSQYLGLDANLDIALRFAATARLDRLAPGRNEITGDGRVYANRFDYETAPGDELFFEAPRRPCRPAPAPCRGRNDTDGRRSAAGARQGMSRRRLRALSRGRAGRRPHDAGGCAAAVSRRASQGEVHAGRAAARGEAGRQDSIMPTAEGKRGRIMKDLTKYHGIIPALYACYDDDGRVDVRRTRHLARHWWTRASGGCMSAAPPGNASTWNRRSARKRLKP